MVAEALELIGGLKPIVKNGDVVVILPCPSAYLMASTTAGGMVTTSIVASPVRPGQATDPRVLEALIREIQRTAECRILLATDGPAPEAYAALAAKYGVELKDLGKDTRVSVPSLYALPDIDKYEMPETIINCDVLIDVPTMRTDSLTGVSLGMKNLMELLTPPRDQFVGKIDDILCDIVVKSDKPDPDKADKADAKPHKPNLVIVDGLVGTEGQGPVDGKPVKMDLILAGRNVVAVDSVAAAVMGYDPQKISHLAKAGKAGLGENDLAKIGVRGRPIAEVKRLFAYAMRDARVVLSWTAEHEKKVVELAGGTEDFHGERAAVFKPERFLSDKAKYPVLQQHGFRVFLKDSHDPRQMMFIAPYEAAISENGAAAIEEMKQWIEANLGATDAGEPDA
jgi:uncharacterized protein (DUF362 family)